MHAHFLSETHALPRASVKYEGSGTYSLMAACPCHPVDSDVGALDAPFLFVSTARQLASRQWHIKRQLLGYQLLLQTPVPSPRSPDTESVLNIGFRCWVY
jgi:hypothetical protein